MVVYTRNLGTEVEAGGLGVQGQPQLLSEPEIVLGYMRPCLKEIKLEV